MSACTDFLEQRIRELGLECKRIVPAEREAWGRMLRLPCWRAMAVERERCISTGITMWCRRNRRNSPADA